MEMQAYRSMHDFCNSLCLPRCFCLYWALRPVLRGRIRDVSKCSPCPHLLAFQLCEQAAIVAHIAKCLPGADKPSLPTVVARCLCERCARNPLAFQVPFCENPRILILHLSFVSQHLIALSCLTDSPVFYSVPFVCASRAQTPRLGNISSVVV